MLAWLDGKAAGQQPCHARGDGQADNVQLRQTRGHGQTVAQHGEQLKLQAPCIHSRQRPPAHYFFFGKKKNKKKKGENIKENKEKGEKMGWWVDNLGWQPGWDRGW